MKIAIGTAQFGLNYGISNRNGITSIAEIKNIFNLAAQNNVEMIDTACLYGTSEYNIGLALNKNHNFKIVTKTAKFLEVELKKCEKKLNDNFLNSLKNLGQKSLYGLLFHDANDLIKDVKKSGALWAAAENLKKKGLVQKIGVSVYNEEQINYIINNFEIDLIQIPINLFDQRLLKSGCLVKIKAKNIEIHARSIFLQGLLLMRGGQLHKYFDPIKNDILNYYQTLEVSRINKLEGAIGFVKNIKEIDYAIFGMNNGDHFLEIISACNANLKDFDYLRFAINDEKFVNPAKWQL